MKAGTLLAIATLSIFYFKTIFAQGYEIERKNDGPVSFSVLGIQHNEGSTLQRESIILNDPSSPVILSSHSIHISFESRGYNYNGTTIFDIKSPIVALEFRTYFFDIFGQHMGNLSNIEVRDLTEGSDTITGVWRARDNDVQELLTTVTYVARVRLADGTQWMFNFDNVTLALAELNLEQEFEEENQLD